MKELTEDMMEWLVYEDERLFKLWQKSKLEIEDYVDRDFKLIGEIYQERLKMRYKNDKTNCCRK